MIKKFIKYIGKNFGNPNGIGGIISTKIMNIMEKCFSEIKRILKQDGIFINVIYSKEFLNKIIYTKYGFNKYTIEEIKNITEENGMKIIKIIELKKNKSYCIISKNDK